MAMVPILLPVSLVIAAVQLPITVDGQLCNPTRLMAYVEPQRQAEFDAAVSTAGGTIFRRYPEINTVCVQTPPGMLQATRARLQASKTAVRVDLDRAAMPAYTPNDQMWPQQWHLRTVQVDKAWDLSLGSPVPIAVIDTGVEVSHPDLAANIWINTKEVPNNGIDDDGNGYTDDVNGWDFAYGDKDPDDQYGHGTSCAGLAAAVGDNGIGVTGMAPRAKIMALKASTNEGYFYDSNDVAAFIYAANNGARVLSMSFFSDRVSNSERLAIDYAWSKGVLPVAAAGNSAHVYPFYPAAYENTLAVAATREDNSKASFSDYGSWVDVAAPGVSLTTTAVFGGYTNGFGGTSGACPHVAGLAALLFGANPLATNAQVRAAIEDTAVLLNEPPYGEFSNYGLIESYAAMRAILGNTSPGKPPVVRYMTPVTPERTVIQLGNRIEIPPSRIYGRGFQSPRKILVTQNGRFLKIVGRSRDWLDVILSSQRGPVQVTVDGQMVGTVVQPNIASTVYPGIEASEPGATATNAFFTAFLNPDGNVATFNTRGDGLILVQAPFRRVRPTFNMVLRLRRQYLNGAGRTEQVYLYDWTSASYPYGNYVLLSSVPTPSSMTTIDIPVPNASRFVDPEGTAYFYLESGNHSQSAQLKIDEMLLMK